jgi:hypothetical protein
MGIGYALRTVLSEAVKPGGRGCSFVPVWRMAFGARRAASPSFPLPKASDRIGRLRRQRCVAPAFELARQFIREAVNRIEAAEVALQHRRRRGRQRPCVCDRGLSLAATGRRAGLCRQLVGFALAEARGCVSGLDIPRAPEHAIGRERGGTGAAVRRGVERPAADAGRVYRHGAMTITWK